MSLAEASRPQLREQTKTDVPEPKSEMNIEGRYWCPCRKLIIIGGCLMLIAPALGAIPHGKVQAWQDPAWITAMAGLLAVLFGFFAPAIDKLIKFDAIQKELAVSRQEVRDLIFQLSSRNSTENREIIREVKINRESIQSPNESGRNPENNDTPPSIPISRPPAK